MPDFDAYRAKLNERLGQHAPPFVAWVDKLEQFSNAQDRKIAELDDQIRDQADKDATIKSLEEEMALLVEDILDVDRGIKTYEELVVDVRRRA
jgi:uncharacterized coiled-coil protein SlyX